MSEREDIVERLRHPANVFYEYDIDGGAMLREAATEIERLRYENERLQHNATERKQLIERLREENERLRAIVERLDHTADNVPVAGGDVVLDPDTGQWLDVVSDGRGWAYEPGPHYDGDEVRPIKECYSTVAALEAAEAARKGASDEQ